MAATATSNLARLRYIKETNFGTTPSTGNSTDLRFTGESLNFSMQTETSKEIRADRQVADLVQVGAETSGDIQFELSFGSMDDFIAAALGGEWEPDSQSSPTKFTLKNGINVPFFSIEKGFTDINQFILYRGMAVNKMSLDFSVGSILTGSFGFLGRDSKISGSSGVPSLGPVPDATEVMNSVSNFADLEVGGDTYDCGISKITLETDGGLRAQNALGHMGACTINAGTFSPTGSMTVYFADGSIYSKYIANSAISVSWSVEDAEGNKYEFSLPRVKITSANPTAGGLDTDVELAIDYQALYDDVEGYTIQIVKTPAIP